MNKITFTTFIILSVFIFTSCKKINEKTEQNSETNAKIFLVLDITVHDSIMYEQYRINVEPIIKKYGGKYLVRSGFKAFDNDPDTKLIPAEGNWTPDRLIITEWESIEKLQKFAKSDEYKQVLKFRTNSSSTKSVIVKEYMKN